jgi:hypothetical protein
LRINIGAVLQSMWRSRETVQLPAQDCRRHSLHKACTANKLLGSWIIGIISCTSKELFSYQQYHMLAYRARQSRWEPKIVCLKVFVM